MKSLAGQAKYILAVLVMLTVAGVALAQGVSTGIMEGTVKDESGNPLAGAAVTATGPQGVRNTVTDNAGRFQIRDLTPGTYSVRADAPNFASVIQTEIEININQRTQVPFVLQKGLTEAVTVTSEAPIVDMRSTSTGANVSVEDFVNYVPLGRNFATMITLAPGAVSGLNSGAGNYSISGSSGLENTYLIDGVNITNSGYGGIGSYNRVYGSLGSGVTNDFIDQVEVKTGGFEAEFGQATGGVVNAIVKSGTNTLSGSVTAYLSPDSFETTRRLLTRTPDAISTKETSNQDFGLNLGGPIVKDRLFWYGAYNPVQTETTFIRTVQDPSVLFIDGDPANGPIDPAQTTGGRTATRKRTNDNYAGKVSWFITPNHRVEATAFGDPSTGDSGPQRSTALRRTGSQGFSELDYGGNNYSLKYSGAITSNIYVDALVARHESNLTEMAVNQYSINDLTVPGGITRGGLGFSPNTDESVDQYGLKLTWVIGDNELKVGYQEDQVEYLEAGAQTGPNFTARLPVATMDAGGQPVWDGTYYDFDSTTGAALLLEANGASPSGFGYTVQRSRFSPLAVKTKNNEKNFFIQDTWSITPKVTLKVGARYTEEYVAGGSPFELPFSIVRRASGTGGNRNRLIDLSTPSDFAPTSNTFPKEWAPRVGVTWDINGDGQHKLYANYAEYVQRLTQDLAYRAFSNEVDIQQVWADEDLTVPFDNGACAVDLGGGMTGTSPCQTILTATGLGGPTTLWPGTELPRTKEFLVGYSHELNPKTGFDLRYVHRELGPVIEDFSYIPQESVANGLWGPDIFGVGPFNPYPQFPSDFFGEYVLANVGDNSREAAIAQALDFGSPAVAALWEDGTIPDFPTATRDYDALEFQFNKRLSDNWLGYLSYRYGRLYGNYEGLLRNDNGQDDPNITSLYDFPATPIMKGQFAKGRLNTDVEHNLKVFGTYLFPMGLNVGGGFNLSTGVPRFPLLTHPNDFYFLPGNGEVPGRNPIYAAWVDIDAADPFDPVPEMLVLADGLGAPFTQMSDGTLDANGDLVFMPYSDVIGSAPDVLVANPVSGAERFIYDYELIRREELGRTPAVVTADLHVSYDIKLGWRKSTVKLALDVFNIFDSQESGPLFDDTLEYNSAETNPNYGTALQFQGPRTFRFGARWSF